MSDKRAIIHPRVRKLKNHMIIYKATNIVNGKIYIGQTINNLDYRKSQHFREAKSKKKENNYFHNAINKYGADNFVFEEIDSAETQDELDDKEIYWINYYNALDKSVGYNCDSGGKSGGVKSDETKEKIGKTTTEKWQNEEIANKMRDGLYKATKKWQEICEENRVVYICPYCGKTMKLPQYDAQKRSSCSRECKKQHGGFAKIAEKASQIGVRVGLEMVHDRREKIKKEVIEWCKSNKEIVVACPYNKISTNLKPLTDFIFKEYGVKDIRSVASCFNITTKKEFLKILKDIVLQ